MSIPRCSLAVALALMLSQSAARAQEAPGPWSAPPPDSTAWTALLTHVVASLAPYIARSAVQGVTPPWLMTLPTGGLAWERVQAQLRAALRARDRSPEDTVYYELTIGPLQVTGDTARVEIRTGMTRRCPGTSQTTGYGNVERVSVVRYHRGDMYFWGAARSGGVAHGDRIGCPMR